jgi:predicted aldo/keto reductase-like oxidoreductase
MQYRQFGKLEWKPMALGFGCMRLPILNQDAGQIDEPEATRMLRNAIEKGLNYVDTAYPYHNGTSEAFVGRALQDGFRNWVALATKLPCWLVKESVDLDRYLNEQLTRLQTDHIDFYLLHALNESSWHKMRDLGALEWAEGVKADGRIRHIGFSFHDAYPVFQEIVDAYEGWDFAQIQYNFMDVNNQAGLAGLKYAAARGMGVIIMEPLLGGRLVRPPQAVQALWETAPMRRSPAAWALQWLWNQPEVSLVLSGMSTMQQVEQNLEAADGSGVGIFSQAELDVVEQVRATYAELCQIPCTACEYCQPCPNKVKIPAVFDMYNAATMYNLEDRARQAYERLPMEERADMCIACRECEEKCPQKILISEWMPEVHQYLSHG